MLKVPRTFTIEFLTKESAKFSESTSFRLFRKVWEIRALFYRIVKFLRNFTLEYMYEILDFQSSSLHAEKKPKMQYASKLIINEYDQEFCFK